MDTVLYIVLDNAGEHGTDAYVFKYINILKLEYNIELIYQVPDSLFTDTLNLGVRKSYSQK